MVLKKNDDLSMLTYSDEEVSLLLFGFDADDTDNGG
jgi:hypothetical protein